MIKVDIEQVDKPGKFFLAVNISDDNFFRDG